jgi:hypothetical protein
LNAPIAKAQLSFGVMKIWENAMTATVNILRPFKMHLASTGVHKQIIVEL